MSDHVGVLARIGVDADALLDHPGQDRPSKNVHLSLTRAIAEVGVLEYSGAADEVSLSEAIKSLAQSSPDIGLLWGKTIEALNLKNRIRHGTGSQSIATALRDPQGIPTLREMVDLIVVSEEAAKGHGVPSDSGYLPGDPALALADAVYLCETVEEVRNLRKRGNFRRGTPRAEVEDAVFKPLARLSTDATVLDRFFLAHAIEPEEEERDHLEWLVSTLNASMRPGSTLRILSELPKDISKAKRDLNRLQHAAMKWGQPEAGANPRQGELNQKRAEIKQKQAEIKQSQDGITARLRERISPLLRGGQLKSVEVVLAGWPRKKEDRPHNRHARFNCSIAISTEEGFDRLDATSLRFLEGFTWKAVTDSDLLDDLDKRERKVLKGWPRFEVLIGQDVPGSAVGA